MATLRCRLNQKNADNTYSVVYLETEASLVLMSDGRTLETALAGIDDDLAAGGKHASTHAIGGTDPVTPGMIGAATTDDIAPLTTKLNELQDMLDDAINKVLTTINTVPYPKNTLTYTGEEQSPEWIGYDPEVMTIGGVTAQTNAGEYEVIFLANKGYQWADGSVAKMVTWTIERAVIAAVPSQSGSLTYNGNEQSPILSGYDANKMSITGNTGTNAGNYTAEIAPNANHKWSDNTTGAKEVAWSIGKAAGNVTVNPTSVTFTSAGGSEQVTVIRDGTGAITASSSNTGVANCSISGNIVTIANGNTNGNCDITVDIAGDDNYNATSVTIGVTRNVYICPAQATLGTTFAWAGHNWIVVHVESDRIYAARTEIYELCQFNNNSSKIYAGSNLAARAMAFQNSLPASDVANALNTTVNGVTAKIFVATMDQLGGSRAAAGDFSYFDSIERRKCNYNGAATEYWSSSPDTGGSQSNSGVQTINIYGGFNNFVPPAATYGFRPFVALKR